MASLLMLQSKWEEGFTRLKNWREVENITPPIELAMWSRASSLHKHVIIDPWVVLFVLPQSFTGGTRYTFFLLSPAEQH